MIAPMTWSIRVLKYDSSTSPEGESHFLQLHSFPAVSTLSVSKIKLNEWLFYAFFYDKSSLS